MGDQHFTHKAERLFDVPHSMEIFPAKLAIRIPRPPVQFFLATVSRDETLIEHQPDDDADGKGAAAKAEAEDFVFIGAVVAAHEFIEIENVSLEPPSTARL